MGLSTGGLNGQRFLVTTVLADDFRDRFLKGVRENAFLAVPDAADGELRHGWVDVFKPASTLFELDTFLFDRFVCLTLRVDKKTVNGMYRKITLTERLAAVRKLRDVKKLSKAEKTDVIEALDAELFGRALPSVATVDVAWDTQSGQVIVFSTSETLVELVKVRFETTFEVHLQPERMVDWLVGAMTWDEIGQRAESFSEARGCRGLGAGLDGKDDSLEGARFEVATDFITWLWFQSEASDKSFKDADLTLWLETRLKLQDMAVTDSPDTTILLGVAPSGTEAARQNLHTGKRPVEARLGLKLGYMECGLTLIATPDGIAVTGMKLPFEIKEGQDEKIHERMLLLDLMHETLKKLFQQFFVARTSPEWDKSMQAWLDTDLAASTVAPQ